jgi:hypothetical protein
MPLAFFVACSPRALVSRFYSVSYIRPDSSLFEIAPLWASNYLTIWDPRMMLVVGDESVRQHVAGMGSVLVGVLLLAVIGAVIALREPDRRSWWLFVVYGTLVSVIPASLTNEPFHSLRLIALPVFLHLLMTPALARIASAGDGRYTRKVVLALLDLAAAQKVWIQNIFHVDGPKRSYEFDAPYAEVLDAAVSTSNEPIYLWDKVEYPSYIHAYWYSTVRGSDLSRFRRLKTSMVPPPGGLVLGTMEPCETCPVNFRRDNFAVYRFEEK